MYVLRVCFISFFFFFDGIWFYHHKTWESSQFLHLPLQVDSLPVPEDWKGLIQRTKRSLLWRWNSMKPVGAGCRDHLECGTKYCRYSRASQKCCRISHETYNQTHQPAFTENSQKIVFLICFIYYFKCFVINVKPDTFLLMTLHDIK